MNLLEKHLTPLFADAMEKKIFSAAAAAFFIGGENGKKRNYFYYGRTRNDNKSEPVSRETFFDLASLTKPLCTFLCILSLIEKGKLTWKSDLKTLKNEKTSPALEKITIEQLLSHSAGLRDYKPFFKEFEAVYKEETKRQIIDHVKKEPLIYQPGERCVYSDLGYILLGEMIEKTAGRGLDEYFKQTITGPLQLDKDIFFRPLSEFWDKNGKNIAATEICPWRKRLLQGEVHDEHSWLMGGIAGHAGLFGTAAGVLAMAENILYQWQGRLNHPAYSGVLLRKALGWHKENHTWALGFDRPAKEGSSAGSYFSSTSVGHLGFTGTSIWIDPEKEFIAVLLTNRVHPTRKNEKIKKFRPLFHDTVIKGLNI